MARDLNETLIFAKVVELGSFTAAARALGLPKTTVSRKVQELEARLAARLLHRSTRRLGLTEAGSLYLEHARRIAHELDQAESAVHQLQGGPRGWLRLSVPYSLGLHGIAPLLVEFRAQHPEVRVDMRMDNAIVDLIAGEFDLALRFGDLPDSTLIARPLARLQTQVFASPAYLAQHGEPLEPEDLAHHRTLAMTQHRQGGRFLWHLVNGEREQDFPVQPVIATNDPFALLPPLLGGEGLMLASQPVVSAALQRGSVRRVLAAWRGPIGQLHAVFPPGRVVPPKVRAFIDFLGERLHF